MQIVRMQALAKFNVSFILSGQSVTFDWMGKFNRLEERMNYLIRCLFK